MGIRLQQWRSNALSKNDIMLRRYRQGAGHVLLYLLHLKSYPDVL